MQTIPALILALSAVLGYPLEANAQTTYLARLAHCESNFKANIKVLDTNNYFSYGIFQYQFATFKKYGKQYGLIPQDMPDNEIKLLIHNPSIQKSLTEKILADGGRSNWFNCTLPLGEYPSPEGL